MLKFNKQLTALAFLTLIAASSTVPAVATQDQSPAEQLWQFGIRSSFILLAGKTPGSASATPGDERR